MQKKAFTLIELAVVVTIIGIVLGTLINFGTATLSNTKIGATKSDLESIKSSLLAYASKHGRLPYPDTDGDGYENVGADCTTQTCELPYLDLNVKGTDTFGMRYSYNVWDELLLTNKDSLCHTMRNYYAGDVLPSVANDDHGTANEKKYSVSAIVLSKGVDKVLTGENSTPNDRIYEMAQNKYHDTDNNDIVVELSPYELLSNLCELTPDHTKGLVVDASLDANNATDLANGTVVGGVTFNTVAPLSYTTYDGSGTQYIQYDLNKTYSRFTVSMWINLNDWDNAARQFFWTAETDEIRLEITGGAIVHRPAPIGNGDHMNVDLGLVGAAGWHYVTFTQRRTSPTNVEASFYLDGILQSRVNGDWDDLTDTFYIGSWASRGSDGLSGSIDDLKFYDYDRLESDIASYFNSTKADYGF
jgi:prepilin-type N-terminal cleavage/methylation domain-containing protein